MERPSYVLTQQLGRLDRRAILRHLHRLSPEDHRLRFGVQQAEASLRRYVDGIDFERDALFGVFDDDLELVGFAHVALGEEAEFGVSVDPAHRGRGIGTALLARSMDYARNRMIPTLLVHCLAENRAMYAMARKAGMQIVTASGEADAYLKLPPPDAASVSGELLNQRVALFDFALKAQVAAAKRFSAVWRGKDKDAKSRKD